MSSEPSNDARPEPAAAEPREARPCPTCGAETPATGSHHPFCSNRCRMADLGRWFSGEYFISRRLEERDIEETE